MTICLNAIVKNEATGIRVMLESVADFISTYVIVDTGSTDNTKQVIKDFFDSRGIDGEIHDRPWYNDFGKSRTEAIRLAQGKGDYLLFMDATDQFIGKPGILELDQYKVTMIHSSTRFERSVFVKNDDKFQWRYEGVLHEYLTTDEKVYSRGFLKDCTIRCNVVRGCRESNPNKYSDDARCLEEALKKDPDNSRYQFYLGQSYRDSGQHEKAIEAYTKRMHMGGWEEEIYDSMYNIGVCMIRLDRDEDEVEKWLEDTFKRYPHRSEPLYQLARYFRLRGNHKLSYIHGVQGIDIVAPDDGLFVNSSIYKYLLKDEVAIASYYVGDDEMALRLNLDIIDKVPESQIPRIKTNMKYSINRLLSKK